MAYVYILYSTEKDGYYVGSCVDLVERFKEHRDKKYPGSFTSGYNDWELYLCIEGLDYHLARSIEFKIKQMKSKKYIENLKKYPELIEKLRLQANQN